MPILKINQLEQCSDFNDKLRIFAWNEDKTENLKEHFENENEVDEDELITNGFYRFLELYKTKFLITQM